MSNVKIFWDPMGFKLDVLGKKKIIKITDGDTPLVALSIRMLSIDTPEIRYPGNQKSSKQDDKLAQLADWIRKGKAPVSDGLAEYLYPKLATGKAGTLQENQGIRAAAKFEELLLQKLRRPKGQKRNVFLHCADKPFDEHNRLLAYIAPYYTPKELVAMSRKERATFNLLMVESGWAASFPIYPNLPKHIDLVLLQETAKSAYENKNGAWVEPLMLTGYEFRMCVKLYDIVNKLLAGKKLSRQERNSWVTRFCVDMTTREIFYPQSYYKVAPYNRIFIWPKDVSEAVGKMNLSPAER